MRIYKKSERKLQNYGTVRKVYNIYRTLEKLRDCCLFCAYISEGQVMQWIIFPWKDDSYWKGQAGNNSRKWQQRIHFAPVPEMLHCMQHAVISCHQPLRVIYYCAHHLQLTQKMFHSAKTWFRIVSLEWLLARKFVFSHCTGVPLQTTVAFPWIHFKLCELLNGSTLTHFAT